jgi:enoyl-CoA hydratase
LLRDDRSAVNAHHSLSATNSRIRPGGLGREKRMSVTNASVGRIRTEVHGYVFKIIIDNVAKKNFFSPWMIAEISDAFTLLDRTDDYWVGVLCAEGPDFTAGLDIPKFFGPKAERIADKPGNINAFLRSRGDAVSPL